MKNVHSSDGKAEDILRSIAQMACVEMHYKTLLEKRTSEVENGIIDIDDNKKLQEQLELIDSIKEKLDEAARLRRYDMLYLYEEYGSKGNKESWCLVKHLSIAAMTAFEAYQASNNEPELLNQYLAKNKLLIQETASFLGMEITECAACFADMIKGEK